jgi:transposase
VGEQALKLFGQFYEVERTAAYADSAAPLEARQAERALINALHQWLRLQRRKHPGKSC